MKLIASMICRNELERYLRLSVPALLSFCDEVRVVDDASADGTYEWLLCQDRVKVKRNDVAVFSENEGVARQELFEWTLEGEPSHVLSIDADEFVSDGQKLRGKIEAAPDVPVWGLLVCEVWLANEAGLWNRVDGGWAPQFSPILFAAPPGGVDNRWRIAPRKLACGREPYAVVEMAREGLMVNTPVELLHFGWTRESTRVARYRRYAEQDGGQFHASAHIESIIQTAGVKLEGADWPVGVPRDPMLGLLGA